MTKKDEIKYLDDEGDIFRFSRGRSGNGKSMKIRDALSNLSNKSVKVALIPCFDTLDGRGYQSITSSIARTMGLRVKTSYYTDKTGNYVAIAFRENGDE